MLRSDRVKRIPDCLAGILSNATVKIVKAKKKKKSKNENEKNNKNKRISSSSEELCKTSFQSSLSLLGNQRFFGSSPAASYVQR